MVNAMATISGDFPNLPKMGHLPTPSHGWHAIPMTDPAGAGGANIGWGFC